MPGCDGLAALNGRAEMRFFTSAAEIRTVGPL
jgi:hypothetical protein